MLIIFFKVSMTLSGHELAVWAVAILPEVRLILTKENIVKTI